MAANYDGSIRINSKIDTAGVTTGLSTITSGLKSFMGVMGVAFSVSAIANWAKAAKDAYAEQVTNETKLITIMRQRTGASDSQIQSIVDLTEAQKKLGIIDDDVQLAGAQQLATFTTTTGQLKALIPAMNNLVAQQDGYNASAESATGVANLMGKVLEGQTGALTRVGISFSDAQAEAIKYGDKTQRAAVLAQVITDNVGEMNKALANTEFGREKQLANTMEDVNKQFGRAITKIETLFIPALSGLAQWLSYIASLANSVAQVISNIFGGESTTYDNVATSADGASKSVDGLTDSTEASGEAAKEASDNLAGFDKINTLSQDNTDSSGASTPTAGQAGAGGIPTGKFNSGDLEAKVKASMERITIMVSGFLLALGAILTFSGAAPKLGIALMIAGAAGLAAEAIVNWSTIQKALQGPIGEITALVSIALLALGAVIAFSGANIGLGIALMAAGAAGLATVVAVNWQSIQSAMQGPVGEIAALIGGALLVLGAAIAFSGANVPLGISLMAAGAIGLATVVAVDWKTLNGPIGNTLSEIATLVGASLLTLGAMLAFSGVNTVLGISLIAAGAATLVTTTALNWNTIKSALKGPIGEITALVGGSMLALGAMLAFSGVGLPLGLSLIAAGATSLVTVTAVNWESITAALQGPIGEVTALTGGALLAIGAMLAFSGVGLPLGIALIAAGAASLVTVTALNWESITTALKGPIGETTAITGAALLALGAILCFSGVGIPLGIGLLIAGGAALATAIAPNWNAIPDKIKGIWGSIKGILNNDIIAGVESFINFVIGGFNRLINYLNGLNIKAPDWVTKATGIESFGFNITPFSNVSIPRLAQGAVIPPNRQFAAILGDQTSGVNIESPLSTMVDAFKAALSDMGGTSSNTRPINIIASADSAGLIQFFKFEIEKETSRVGTKLVTGGGR